MTDPRATHQMPKADAPPVGRLRMYHVQVSALGEDGDEADLGEWEGAAANKQQAHQLALNELWDDRLDTASCLPQFETEELSRYIGCTAWSHAFSGEPVANANWTRWLLDRTTKSLVTAEAQQAGEWRRLTQPEAADLLSSLHEEKVLADPEGSGCEVIGSLVGWAGVLQRLANDEQQEITVAAVRERRG